MAHNYRCFDISVKENLPERTNEVHYSKTLYLCVCMRTYVHLQLESFRLEAIREARVSTIVPIYLIGLERSRVHD